MTEPNCPHGLPTSTCLICHTLQNQPQVQVETSAQNRPHFGSDGQVTGVGAVRPDAVFTQGRAPGQPRSIGTHIALLVVGLAVIALVTWIVAGAIFALLHLIELFIVAGIAGWAGYRLGYFRGRRRRP